MNDVPPPPPPPYGSVPPGGGSPDVGTALSYGFNKYFANIGAVLLIILVAFAAFGSIGFGASLAALLWMSTILSAIIGAMRHEPPFGMVLNHWDETLAFAAVFSLVSSFNHAVPA